MLSCTDVFQAHWLKIFSSLKVYKGRRKHTLEVVALKFITKTGRKERELRLLNREIDIMQGMNHPNIIRMLDTFETPSQVRERDESEECKGGRDVCISRKA